MISMLIGVFGAVIALGGWFGFHSVAALIIGTAMYIIETIMEWNSLNTNAKMMDIVIFVIGSIIAIIFTSAPWYVGGMVAVAIYGAIMSMCGLILTLRFF